MRYTKLLSTTAVALLLSAGLATAQSPQQNQKSEGATRAPQAQQNAPAEKMGPSLEQKKADTTGQASQADSPKSAQDNKSDKGSATTGQAPKPDDASKTEKSGASSSDMKSSSGAAKSPADTKSSADTKSTTDTKSSADTKSATDTKSSADTKSSTTSGAAQQSGAAQSSTSGQGAAGASASLTTEQRTKITSIIKQQKVAPVQVNFSLTVGTRVPQNVRFYPLPQEVVVIYPQWRGYDYILVGDTIIIIDPRTREIVAVLTA